MGTVLGTDRSSGCPRILVIRPDRIGDVVLTTPLIRALRSRYPGAYLASLVCPYSQAVLEGTPHLDRILLDDPDGNDRGLRGFWSLVARIRLERFGVSLMVLPTRRHAMATLFAGIPTRIGVGRKPYEVLTGSRPAGRNRDRPVRHEADYCLDLGRAIGVDPSELTPEVFLNSAERAEARERLKSAGVGPGMIVGVHPGSGGSAPNWDPKQFAALARSIVEELGAWVVVTGDEGDLNGCSEFSGGAQERIVDLSGCLSLRELMGVISACDVLVSSSTGPMHLAAALGVPCVALFCPRTACCPARWGPLGERHRVLLPVSDRCQTCGRVRDPECRLEGISLGRALEAVRGIVG